MAGSLCFKDYSLIPKAHSLTGVILLRWHATLIDMSKKSILFLAAGMACCLVSRSQTDTTSQQLGEVVVTATKYPVKQSTTGKVILVISRSDLANSPGKTLGQILNEQAGITVSGSLNNWGTNQGIYMRGAATGRTLITLDGIPLNDPSTINNEFDINLVSLDNIERIEICKGAQSTLYGSDAVAGVINIITTRASPNGTFRAGATLMGGSFGTLRGSGDFHGKMTDKLFYDIRYTKHRTDGFSSAFDSSGKGHFDHDGYRGDVLTSNITFQAASAITLKGFAQYAAYQADLDQSAFTDARNYTSTNKNLMLGGGIVYKLSATTLTGNYLFNNSSRLLQEDSILGQSYLHDHYFGTTQFVEVYGSTPLGGGFTLLNGADYKLASMHEEGVSGTYKYGFKDTSLSQTSMYSSLLFTGRGGLGIELGGRLNTHSRYGSNQTYTFNPSYHFSEKLKIYGSLATGFKAPSLYQLYAQYSGNPNLKPENSLNYEAGLQFNPSQLKMRLTYFNRRIDNGIDFNYFSYIYFNISRESDQGLEWESSWKMSEKCSLSLNYTWLRARERSQSRLTYLDTTYAYALRRPEHTLNLQAAITPFKKVYISTGAHYESRRYDIGGFDANYQALPDAMMKGFLIFNAYGSFEPGKKLKVFLDLKNLTNRKFVTIYGYNSIPFLLMAGLSVKI